MADPEQFFHVLEHELPDPGESLFRQRNKDLKQFTLFPRLPFELRSVIWKLAIQPRHVDITNPCGPPVCLSSGKPKSYSTRCQRKQDVVPALFHATSESRKETIGGYIIRLPHELFLGYRNKPEPSHSYCRFDYCSRLPIVFHPTIDLIKIQFGPGPIGYRIYNMAKFDFNYKAEILASIRAIELSGLWINDRGMICAGWNLYYSLLDFTSLKVLLLTIKGLPPNSTGPCPSPKISPFQYDKIHTVQYGSARFVCDVDIDREGVAKIHRSSNSQGYEGRIIKAKVFQRGWVEPNVEDSALQEFLQTHMSHD